MNIFFLTSLCHVNSIAMLFCFPVQISLKSDDRLLSYGQKRFLKWPSAIMNFKNFHIWSSGYHRATYLLLCTKFHQNRMILRLDMAISRYSRWRMSAILNFIGLMNSLRNPCRTFYWSSINIIALL